jgi:hypothetical protein
MAWSSKTDATQLTSVTNTEQFFSTIITLNPGEVAQCEVISDPPPTPTDDLIVAVYATLDDTTEDWDDIPIMEFMIPNDIDPSKRTFLVSGVYKFRVGVRSSGGTDSFIADFSYRTDGVVL